MAKVKKPKIDKKYDPLNNRNFKSGDNVSDNLANNHFQYVEIYHVPSKYFVTFKAYITNFSDSISAEWNSKSVYGRKDPIFKSGAKSKPDDHPSKPESSADTSSPPP